jgi:ribonucleotide reductase alpha subunit
MLKETITVAIRALDNVIDINFYPTEAAKRSNIRHRPIGLGVMGVQNALFKRGFGFASQDAVEFNDEFMECIAYHAYSASSDLAAERGPYSSFRGSKWDRGLLPQDTIDLLERERGVKIDVPRGGKLDWTPVREKIKRQGMRNSNVLAIAPTATISNITGTTPCIEPNYKNLYVKSNLSGDFIVLNSELVKDLKKAGLWNQDMLDQLKYFDGELDAIDERLGTRGNRLFYLASSPTEFDVILENLSAGGLSHAKPGSWSRLIVEKPFGTDLPSAHRLNAAVVAPAHRIRPAHYQLRQGQPPVHLADRRTDRRPARAACRFHDKR